MSAKAFVDYDFLADGVKIVVSTRRTEDTSQVVIWGTVAVSEVHAATTLPDDAVLRLSDDVARAMYEALSRYYGGNVTDITTLRKDYDAERARVDIFIRHLTVGVR